MQNITDQPYSASSTVAAFLVGFPFAACANLLSAWMRIARIMQHYAEVSDFLLTRAKLLAAEGGDTNRALTLAAAEPEKVTKALLCSMSGQHARCPRKGGPSHSGQRPGFGFDGEPHDALTQVSGENAVGSRKRLS